MIIEFKGMLNFLFRTVLFFKAVRKINEKFKKNSHHPNFSQNLDENLKIYLVWPKQKKLIIPTLNEWNTRERQIV